MANKKTKKAPKKTKKAAKKVKYYILSILAIIAITALFYFYKDNIFFQDRTVATVNGQTITLSEINKVYSYLPEQYKEVITKDMVLNQTINEILLLQEAEKNYIKTTEEEVEDAINNAIAQTMLSRKEFEEKLKESGLTMDYLKDSYKKQLTIFRLLNGTIFSSIVVSDSAIKNYYEQSGLNVSFDEVKEQIKQRLLIEKQELALNTYLNQLRSNANIEIFFEEQKPAEIKTFKITGDDICKEDNKPVITLFSTTKCSHCTWIKETFDSIAKEYMEKGKIVAYHWELDIGDNILTTAIEKGTQKTALNTFQKYSPRGAVPTFVFGCKYIRIGNGYEAENSLESEEKEFRLVIERLLA